MGTPLYSMPTELYSYTRKQMPLADYISWWRTSDELRRRLNVGLSEVKDYIPHSKEGKLALEKTITAEQALLRTHLREERFALAMPYSMILLAHGRGSIGGMTYSGGILCYMQQDSVRVLDVHGASITEAVIDMKKVLAELPQFDPGTPITHVGNISTYENGILVMRAVPDGNPWWVAIDVREKVVSTTQRPSRIRRTLRQNWRYDQWNEVVTTDGRYLVCVEAPVNVTKWTLKCYDLSKEDDEATDIALHEFLPRVLDCHFKIFDGWFYAICANEEGEVQFQQDGEEKLYYNCCRFPIDDLAHAKKPEWWTGPESHIPLPARLQAVQLLRGFGKDAWKQRCNALVKDEPTGDLFIVESASSTEESRFDNPYRRIIFPDPDKHPRNSYEANILDIVQFEQESSSRDHYIHQTIAQTGQEEVRKYVGPSQSIMNVTHGYLGDRSDQHVLHLCAHPVRPDARSTGPDARSTDPDARFTGPNARSTDRGIWRFPPQSAPHELRNFLTMSKLYIHAHADERSLVILTSDWEAKYRLILVNFDSEINFPDLKYLAMDNLSDKLSSFGGDIDLSGASRSKDIRQLQVKLLELAKEATTSSTSTSKKATTSGTSTSKEATTSSTSTSKEATTSSTSTSKAKASDDPKAEAPDAPKAETPVAHHWFTTDNKACYVSIKQGYQFYPPKPTTA